MSWLCSDVKKKERKKENDQHFIWRLFRNFFPWTNWLPVTTGLKCPHRAHGQPWVIHYGITRGDYEAQGWDGASSCLFSEKALKFHRVLIWPQNGRQLSLPGMSGCWLADIALSSPWVCWVKDAFIVIFQCLPWSVDCSILSFCRFCFLHGLLLPLNCT